MDGADLRLGLVRLFPGDPDVVVLLGHRQAAPAVAPRRDGRVGWGRAGPGAGGQVACKPGPTMAVSAQVGRRPVAGAGVAGDVAHVLVVAVHDAAVGLGPVHGDVG